MKKMTTLLILVVFWLMLLTVTQRLVLKQLGEHSMPCKELAYVSTVLTLTPLHIFKTVVHPVLVYGLECVYQTKTALHKAEVSQAKLLKAALGLIYHYCRLLIFRMCASQLKYKN